MLQVSCYQLWEMQQCSGCSFTHIVLPTPGHRRCADCAAELAWGSGTAPWPGFLPAAWSVPPLSVFPLLLFSRENEVSQKWLKRKNVPKVETLLQLPPIAEKLPYLGQITVSSNFGPPTSTTGITEFSHLLEIPEEGTFWDHRYQRSEEHIRSKICKLYRKSFITWHQSSCYLQSLCYPPAHKQSLV